MLQYGSEPVLVWYTAVGFLVGAILSGLHEMDLLDSTLVVFVSDHGEGLGDHNYNFHGHRLYREQVQIPVILWRPGLIKRGHRVEAMIESVDLHPTILDLLGIDRDEATDLDGTSLAAFVMAPSEQSPARYAREFVYAEALGSTGRSPLFSIRDRHWKLILKLPSQRKELYHLTEDYAEMSDLSDERTSILARLRAELDPRIDLTGSSLDEEMDEATMDLLRSLGYVD